MDKHNKSGLVIVVLIAQPKKVIEKKNKALHIKF